MQDSTPVIVKIPSIIICLILYWDRYICHVLPWSLWYCSHAPCTWLTDVPNDPFYTHTHTLWLLNFQIWNGRQNEKITDMALKFTFVNSPTFATFISIWRKMGKWSLPCTARFCALTSPLHCHPPSEWQGYFRANPFRVQRPKHPQT